MFPFPTESRQWHVVLLYYTFMLDFLVKINTRMNLNVQNV